MFTWPFSKEAIARRDWQSRVSKQCLRIEYILIGWAGTGKTCIVIDRYFNQLAYDLPRTFSCTSPSEEHPQALKVLVARCGAFLGTYFMRADSLRVSAGLTSWPGLDQQVKQWIGEWDRMTHEAHIEAINTLYEYHQEASVNLAWKTLAATS